MKKPILSKSTLLSTGGFAANSPNRYVSLVCNTVHTSEGSRSVKIILLTTGDVAGSNQSV